MDQKDVNINERHENQTTRKVNLNNEDQVKDRKTNEVKRKKISSKQSINQKSMQNGSNSTNHCKQGSGSNEMYRSKKQTTVPDKSTRNDDCGQKSTANKTKRAIQSKDTPFTNKSSAHANTIPNQKAEELRKQTVQTHSKSGDNSKVLKSKANSEKERSKISHANKSKDAVYGRKNKVPSCKDCKFDKCTPFNSNDIKAIIASQRSNGALYYKIKWQNGTSDWYFPCKIPNHLIREYHANRTMSGKRRKKPLQQTCHKFFTEAKQTINSAQPVTEVQNNIPTEKQNVTSLKGVKLINGRSFYVTQNGNSSQELQPTRMAHRQAREFITYLIDMQQQRSFEDRKRRFPAMDPSPLSAILFDMVYEIRRTENDTWEFLVSYWCKDLAPEWLSLKRIPESSLNLLIKFLKQDYYAAIGKRFKY